MLGIRHHVSCVPVVSHLVERLLVLTEGVLNPIQFTTDPRDGWRADGMKTINAETWAMFTDVTGVSQTEAEQLIEYFQTIVKLPCLINHPVATRLTTRV